MAVTFKNGWWRIHSAGYEGDEDMCMPDEKMSKIDRVISLLTTIAINTAKPNTVVETDAAELERQLRIAYAKEEADKKSEAKRERCRKLLVELNREVVGYPDYSKLNGPAVDALRSMGLVTTAVK